MLMNLLLSLRGFMLVEGLACGMLYAYVAGGYFFRKGLAFKVIFVGLGGLIGYVTVVQVKAYHRQSPFDLYSVSGLLALTITMVGLVLHILHHPFRQTDGT